MEKLLKRLLDLGVALGRRVTQFGKQIVILVHLVGAVPVTGYPRNVSKRGVDMWHARAEGQRLRRHRRW